MTGLRHHPKHKAGGPGAPRVLVIFNPVAGIRRKLRFEHILDFLEGKGCRVMTRPTGKRGNAGTVNEVLNGLSAKSVPVGIIPLGTANVLAAEMGLVIDAESVAEAIANGGPTTIHLGEANGRIFVPMVGVGFDARVVEGVDSRLKRWLGKGAYVWRSMVEMVRFPFIDYRVVIGNGRYYCGAFARTPDARLYDPSPRVCLFRNKGTINAMLLGCSPTDCAIIATWTFLRRTASRFPATMAVPFGAMAISRPGYP